MVAAGGFSFLRARLVWPDHSFSLSALSFDPLLSSSLTHSQKAALPSFLRGLTTHDGYYLRRPLNAVAAATLNTHFVFFSAVAIKETLFLARRLELQHRR